MYRLVFQNQPQKALRRMPRQQAARILDKLKHLAQDPYAPDNNVSKLSQRPGYRLRVGDWRVIYDIIDNELVIMIARIAPRGDAYR